MTAKWIKLTNPITIWGIIPTEISDETTPKTGTATILWANAEDNLMLFSCDGKYVITNKIFPDITLTSNYPQTFAGTYEYQYKNYYQGYLFGYNDSVFTFKKANDTDMLIHDPNFKVGQIRPHLNYFKHPFVTKLNRQIYDRDGVVLEPYKYLGQQIAMDNIDIVTGIGRIDFDTSNSASNGVMELLYTALESDPTALAKTNFVNNGYYIEFKQEDFVGWTNTTLQGLYMEIGSSTGDLEVGWQYYDVDSTDLMVLGIDILQVGTTAVYELTYNSNTYQGDKPSTTNTVVFTNVSDPADTIDVEFNKYDTLITNEYVFDIDSEVQG